MDICMMNKHQHKNCCEHNSVKYCKVCKLVYCESCGKEWCTHQFSYGGWTNTWTTPSVPYNGDVVYGKSTSNCSVKKCQHQ
jgi:hypothetical protein